LIQSVAAVATGLNSHVRQILYLGGFRMKKVCMMLVLGCVALAICVSSASALPPFNKEWRAKYVEGNNNAKFVDAVETAKCNVCHMGKSKKEKNEYGKAVGKYLTKDAHTAAKKISEDAAADYIKQGLAKAEAEKSSSGKTFGELIKAGELPGGGQ
jgi:hypothetical protein